ncbi:MAG: hypothetical protein GX444_14310 [Myxococcales bacterium]|nr:hypothetical protein [Myxococcales bacterium]
MKLTGQFGGTVLLLLLLTTFYCCSDKQNDDDNDNDDSGDDTGNGEQDLPDNIEACEPFSPAGNWFEFVDDIEAAQREYLKQFGSGAFVAGKARVSGNSIDLEIDDWRLTMHWLSDVVRRPFADGQSVLIYMRGDIYEYSRANLWVLNEDRETLLYWDEATPSGNIGDQFGENSILLVFDFACEYRDHGPPEPYYGWRRVFGMDFSGSLDGSLIGGYPQYSHPSVDEKFNINLVYSYYGRTDTDEMVTDTDVRYYGDMALQIVRAL